MPGVADFPVNLGREICFDSLTKDTVIQMTSAYQMSELHEALWYDNNSEAKQVVAAAREDKTLKKLLLSEDRDGRSPLIYAVLRRNIPMVKLLIDEGAPVNYQHQDNVRPLPHPSSLYSASVRSRMAAKRLRYLVRKGNTRVGLVAARSDVD